MTRGRSLALACGLQESGHEVRLYAEQSCLGSAARHGVAAEALAGDLKSILPLADPARELRTGDFISTLRASFRLINDNAEAWLRSIAAHARDADVVLYSSLAAAMGESVAQVLGKPAIGLWLQPTTPTGEFAACTLPPMKLPAWLNRMTYRAAPNALVRRFYGKATRAACNAVFGRHAALAQRSTSPVLYGFSRHLIERPRDWPLAHTICGHWPLPPAPWQAPANLLEFLQGGEAPIYVGFGAMSSFFRRKAVNEIAAAVAGRRALFYPGWSQISADMLPGNFFVVGETPHEWLFPRTCMVVHHGGAGTTHTAARAGVPSIVLPVAVDQFFWASRLAALGVAPPYVRAAKFDARSLARMFEYADGELVRGRARALGHRLSQEHGVRNAVRAIEAHAQACRTAMPPHIRR